MNKILGEKVEQLNGRDIYIYPEMELTEEEEKQAKLRIDELNKLTAYYATKYYDDDSPEISDFEYDMLMNELKNLEREFPQFVSKDSLTQKVGGHVKEGFENAKKISITNFFKNKRKDYCLPSIALCDRFA